MKLVARLTPYHTLSRHLKPLPMHLPGMSSGPGFLLSPVPAVGKRVCLPGIGRTPPRSGGLSAPLGFPLPRLLPVESAPPIVSQKTPGSGPFEENHKKSYFSKMKRGVCLVVRIINRGDDIRLLGVLCLVCLFPSLLFVSQQLCRKKKKSVSHAMHHRVGCVLPCWHALRVACAAVKYVRLKSVSCRR